MERKNKNKFKLHITPTDHKLARACGKATPQWISFNFEKWMKEFSLKTLWTSRKLSEMILYFFTTLLISFSPSIFDMSTDFSSTFTYFYGTDYTKHVENISESTKDGCTLIETTVNTKHMSNQTTETFTLSCFEKDYIYSAVTLFFTFLPSVIFVYCGVYQGTLSVRRWYSVFTIPFLLFTFPLQLVAVKLLHLINPGQQMSILSALYGFCESQGESTFQLCAQQFMVLSRADREASIMQILSIAASYVTVIKPSLEQFLGEKKHMGSLEDVLTKYFKYIPLFLSTTIFRILSIAMICVLLRWNAVYFYIIVYGSALLTRVLTLKYGTLSFKLFENIVPENLTITRSYTYNSASRKETLSNMLLWTFVNFATLTTLAVLGNYNHLIGIRIPSLFPFLTTTHSWAEIPLVGNISVFNGLYAISMGTGTVSLILFILQIFWANLDPDGEHYIGNLRKTSAPAMCLQIPRRQSLMATHIEEKMNLMTPTIPEESSTVHNVSGRDI